jgi:acyl-CoA synthetase (AMP-forming)/AMP-acid ligase II
MNLYAAALVTHLGAAVVGQVGTASHAFLTPAGLIDLLGLSAPADLRIVVAGDRLSPKVADRAEERGWRVSHYYGAAQLSFVAWGRDAADLRPFPRVRAKARGSELWISSPWLCEGEVLFPGMPPSMAVEHDIEGRRWVCVGDQGELTTDGRIIVTGRRNAIVVGGTTVLIGDIEAALHDAASGDVYVVALAHDRLGSVMAGVCTDADDLVTLRHHARTVLDRAHRPVRWVHVPILPVTAAGKVDRNALAALARRA